VRVPGQRDVTRKAAHESDRDDREDDRRGLPRERVRRESVGPGPLGEKAEGKERQRGERDLGEQCYANVANERVKLTARARLTVALAREPHVDILPGRSA
jgi:hypothetical protein